MNPSVLEAYENVYHYLNQSHCLSNEVFNNVSPGHQKEGVDSLDNFLVLCKTPRFPFTREHYDFYTASSQNLKLNKDFWFWFINQNSYYRFWWFGYKETAWEVKIRYFPQLTYTSKYIIVDRNIDLPYFNKSVFKTNGLFSINPSLMLTLHEKLEYISTKNISIGDYSYLLEYRENLSSNYFTDYTPYKVATDSFKIKIAWNSPNDLEDVAIERFFEYNVLLCLLPTTSFFFQ